MAPDPRASGLPLSRRVRELAAVFLRLGFLGFGGPAAHLALLEDEAVTRRHWIDRQGFLDLIGATHLIPGPNSTEMAIHLGYLRAGFLGMLVAGACFIVPAASMTGALAWAYVRYGSLPQVAPIFDGIQPAVLAVILIAVIRLSRAAASTRARLAVAAAVTVAVLLGSPEIWTLLAGGAAGMVFLVLVERSRSSRKGGGGAGLLVSLVPAGAPALSAAPPVVSSGALLGAPAAVSPSLLAIGLVFLKVGAFLYGGGYVLVAFLEGELVDQRGWLGGEELLDAIAAGQFTPGPILSTATFVGYLLRGWPGAAVATVAIFLPSFFFVLLLRLALPRLQRGRWTRAFLDAVNASAVGLMAVALVKLGKGALATEGRIDAGAVVIAVASLTVLLRWKVHPAWVVLAGAGAGWLIHTLEGVT